MKDGIESLGRVRAQGILLLALMFLAGAFAGGAIDRGLMVRRGPAGFAPRLPGPMGMAPRGIPPFLEDLELTPAQRTRIEQIVERRRPRADSLVRQTWPRVRALMDSMQLEIRQALTAEQRRRLNEMMPRGRRGPGPR